MDQDQEKGPEGDSSENADAGSLKPQARSLSEQHIRSVLLNDTEADFSNASLKQVIEFFSDQHNVNFAVDDLALREVGATANETINRTLTSVSLGIALRLILTPLKLAFVVKGGTLTITSPNRAHARNPRAKAIISDIHGNVEALDAVLTHIEAQGISEIYCLGDVVGYGPNPCECVDLAMPCTMCILGDHDQAALFDPEAFSPAAERAILWSRGRLEDDCSTEKRWDFFGDMPRNHAESDYLFVHGSPRNPINEAVFPEDIYNRRKMESLFALVYHWCFLGHTHVPGIFTEDLCFLLPEELGYHYKLGSEKVLINVGSVGLPGDGDGRASYAVLDGDSVYFHRVQYDANRTIEKIRRIAELDNRIANRLQDGTWGLGCSDLGVG